MLRPRRVALDPGPAPIELAARDALATVGCATGERLVSFAPLERAFVARLSDEEAEGLATLPWVRSVSAA